MLCEQAKAVRAVKIVGVDDGERRLNCVGSNQHGMCGAPGFRATESRLLEYILHGNPRREARANGLAEGSLDILADDEDDLRKAGADGVVDGVVNDRLATRADRIELLLSAEPLSH